MAARRDPPTGSTPDDPGNVPGRAGPLDAPPEFQRAVEKLRGAQLRPEIVLEDVPAPHRVAPYSAAVTADVIVGDDELATGRLVLLHDPAGHDAWQGTFRCVMYARAEIDADMVTDPLLGSVGWSWLTESLDDEGASFVAESGTVTRVASESFGGMSEEPSRAELEIRASWTPLDDALDRHARAWGSLLCTAAGLPPVPSGVVPLPGRRV
ncbi:MAG TPA: DUF3000 domain-containing protein [Actinopolymorphaceae bacterium]